MATESDKTNTGVVATIVVVGAFAMIVISALMAAMVRAETTELERTRPSHADLETVAALDKGQLEKLNAAPHWADQPGGKVAIPIELAMNIVLDEYRKRPEAASPPPPPGLVMTPPASESAAGPPESASVPPPPLGSAAPSPAPAPTPSPAAPSPVTPTPSPAAPAGPVSP
jgi:hypothetical protein